MADCEDLLLSAEKDSFRRQNTYEDVWTGAPVRMFIEENIPRLGRTL